MGSLICVYAHVQLEDRAVPKSLSAPQTSEGTRAWLRLRARVACSWWACRPDSCRKVTPYSVHINYDSVPDSGVPTLTFTTSLLSAGVPPPPVPLASCSAVWDGGSTVTPGPSAWDSDKMMTGQIVDLGSSALSSSLSGVEIGAAGLRPQHPGRLHG